MERRDLLKGRAWGLTTKDTKYTKIFVVTAKGAKVPEGRMSRVHAQEGSANPTRTFMFPMAFPRFACLENSPGAGPTQRMWG